MTLDDVEWKKKKKYRSLLFGETHSHCFCFQTLHHWDVFCFSRTSCGRLFMLSNPQIIISSNPRTECLMYLKNTNVWKCPVAIGVQRRCLDMISLFKLADDIVTFLSLGVWMEPSLVPTRISRASDVKKTHFLCIFEPFEMSLLESYRFSLSILHGCRNPSQLRAAETFKH